VDTTPTRRRPSRVTSWISEHAHIILDLSEVAAAAGVDITAAHAVGYWYGDPEQSVGQFTLADSDAADLAVEVWHCAPLNEAEHSRGQAVRRIDSVDAHVDLFWTVNA